MSGAFLKVSPLAYGASDRFEFTYSAEHQLPIGSLVEVPFGRRASLGVVTGPDTQPSFAIKPVKRVLDLPPLPVHLIELGRWLSTYYLASPKSIWTTMLPAGLERKRREAKAKAPKPPLSLIEQLTAEQHKAIEIINRGDQTAYLLHGVTGSGKTQVYIELVKQVLAAGQSAIILVPEIALTPQLVGRFEAAFAGRVLTRHSRQSEAQRHQTWEAALSANQPMIAIGPRSALFLPLAKLGLIVIDEAHDQAYKQEQAPKYQADLTAGRLVQLTGAKLVLGTATPSVVQAYLAKLGRLGLAILSQPISGHTPKTAQVVDLRDKSNTASGSFLSKPLLEAVAETLAAGRQSLLFLNRRGSASSQVCGACGQVVNCPNCELPLTFHADLAKMICHHCNHRATPPAVCPACGAAEMRFLGMGTKRIEAEVIKQFPSAKVLRLDRDSFKPGTIDDIYQQLQTGKVDILVGTQMIAKGWDLPNMDTIGVVLADSGLYLPDYTASERTFQLLSQVSGRAGRGEQPARVIIQTYTPEHPAIRAAINQDYESFYEGELAQRQLLGYPPFKFLMKLTYAAKNPDKAAKAATEMGEKLAKQAQLKVVGPAPAFREITGGRYHWQLVVKSPRRQNLVEAAKTLPSDWTVDLDPADLL